MLQWKDIDTVLLDMDGTLLDLHFDNYFWVEYLPKRYAEIKQVPHEESQRYIAGLCDKYHGQLEWYCLDFWGKELALDIPLIKREIAHLIQMRSDVPAFLTALKATNKRVVLVTNAHPDSLSLKIEKTQLSEYIDELISTHQFGVTKESLSLWQQLEQYVNFDKERTLFIDDSIGILEVARTFGIKHIVAIENPDSKQAAREITEFDSISSFEHYTHALTKTMPEKN
ncbi:GMP/IMP nucleotidase [Algibacillus agarilyticus]|uniref:GMP/IMP nucleotidase n=1 Tax=Algibacillus agarilyticus TaxID=2234133 RepID=UPI000DD08835|nr:GMP/IMP nucleotidase [Algibacillus agarilyticus]